MAKQMIDEGLLDLVQGGSLGFDPESGGTYTMRCQYSGESFSGVSLGNVIDGVWNL